MDTKLSKILEKVQKPSKYIGGEVGSIVKPAKEGDVRFAFCFPDTYEIGMSHLGMKILYSLLNSTDHVSCERCFAPWTDMEEQLINEDYSLYSLETLTPLGEFDIIGFTLQYELCYTNILQMLKLSKIPLLASQRDKSHPIIVGGGPCACNPEPLADFFDIFLLGEGEDSLPALSLLIREYKNSDMTKEEMLIKATKIKSVYVPTFYDVVYNEDNTIKSVTAKNGAPDRVEKDLIVNLDESHYPDTFAVPFTDIVHDRAVIEVMRGCIRGCRFCQAGYIYRPLREKSTEVLDRQALDLCNNTGYEELSLCSLSTSDYSEVVDLLGSLTSWSDKENVNLSLPSLRVDNFPKEIVDKLQTLRKSSLTFAPEAGSQRLRDAINKNIVWEDIEKTVNIAFENGYTSLKLYFMMGLPTETMEDIKGIADTAQKIVNMYYSSPYRQKGRSVNVTISCACFVPKPFTPFEFEPQDTMEMLIQKQKYLKSCITSKKIRCNAHYSDVSFLEAVLARGDRRLGKVILNAFSKGCRLDGWGEYFDMAKWNEAFAECGIDPAFYANRTRSYEEISPWNHLDYGIDKSFLVKENQLAHASDTTPNCRDKCSNCGIIKLCGGSCSVGH